MKKIAEIAQAFDMTIAQLAELIGYSRQALYSKEVDLSRKGMSALKKMIDFNQAMYNADIEIAERKFRSRSEAIALFMELIQDGGAPDV